MSYTEFPVPENSGPGGISVMLGWHDQLEIAKLDAQNETNRLLAALIRELRDQGLPR